MKVEKRKKEKREALYFSTSIGWRHMACLEISNSLTSLSEMFQRNRDNRKNISHTF